MGKEREDENLKTGTRSWFKNSSNGHWHGDEFYTRYCDVESGLKLFDLRGLKIYCPCDTDESNFVQYMKDNGLTFKNTSDDYYEHDDLYKWCDIVITNPPFKNNTKWLRWLVDTYDKKFILVQPLFSIKNRYQAGFFEKREWFLDGCLDRFNTPEGEKRAAAVWMSNIKNRNEIVEREEH